MRCSPISNLAGPVRSSEPLSQRGSSPLSGSSSTTTSRSRVEKPSVGAVERAGVTGAAVTDIIIPPYRSDRTIHTVRYLAVDVKSHVSRETSYIVLGLLEQIEPATPYDLKRMAQLSTFNFWAVPHTQLYTECGRLATEGLLSERREQNGRRRRIYRLTKRGRQALERLALRSPPTNSRNCATPRTLKLFFGGDPAKLAAAQLDAHRRKLRAYEELRAEASRVAPRLAARAGSRDRPRAGVHPLLDTHRAMSR